MRSSIEQFCAGTSQCSAHGEHMAKHLSYPSDISLKYPQCVSVRTAKWQKDMRVQMLGKEEEWAGRQEWNCSRCLAEPFYVRCWGKLMYSSRKCQYCIWQYCREEWFMEVPGVWSKHRASEEQHCYRWTSRASCIPVTLSESWMLYSLSFGNPT